MISLKVIRWGLENAFEMVDGCFKLPTAPGLGITIDEDALKRFAYRESSARQFRTIKQEKSP